MNDRPTRAGLYVHVPFCARICPYCEFAVQRDDAALRERYVAAVEREVALIGATLDGDAWRSRGVDTVYFGGGTPSSLAPDELQRILEAVQGSLGVLPGVHVTLEANPEDVTAERLKAWRALGVRMLSLGVQSFDDEELRFLGRRHRRGDAIHAVEQSLDSEFETVSVDVIFGLPHQTTSTLSSTLEAVKSLSPPHVSCYQLTVHEGTPFAKARDAGRLVELGDEPQGDLYLQLVDRLSGFGLQPYEVSNFARSHEHRSRHNQKYWNHTPYLGVGPSAHSFDGVRRWWNHRTLDDWARALEDGVPPVAGEETLTDGDLALETLMLRLRTDDGLSLEAYRDRFGVDLAKAHQGTLEALVQQGLARPVTDVLRLTPRGLAVSDGIVRALGGL